MELLDAVLRWIGVRGPKPTPREQVTVTADEVVAHVGELRIESPDGRWGSVYLDGKELHGCTRLDLSWVAGEPIRASIDLLPCRLKSPLDYGSERPAHYHSDIPEGRAWAPWQPGDFCYLCGDPFAPDPDAAGCPCCGRVPLTEVDAHP